MKSLRQFTLLLLGFTALSAILTSLLLFADVDGSLLGISYSYLSESPFKNFKVPAIILFFIIGVPGVIVTIVTYKSMRGYLWFIMGYAMLLLIFIIVQVKIVDTFNFINTFYIVISLLLMAMAWLIKGQHHKTLTPQQVTQHKKSNHHSHRHKKH